MAQKSDAPLPTPAPFLAASFGLSFLPKIHPPTPLSELADESSETVGETMLLLLMMLMMMMIFLYLRLFLFFFPIVSPAQIQIKKE
jgi:hypothetical protein